MYKRKFLQIFLGCMMFILLIGTSAHAAPVASFEVGKNCEVFLVLKDVPEAEDAILTLFTKYENNPFEPWANAETEVTYGMGNSDIIPLTAGTNRISLGTANYGYGKYTTMSNSMAAKIETDSWSISLADMVINVTEYIEPEATPEPDTTTPEPEQTPEPEATPLTNEIYMLGIGVIVGLQVFTLIALALNRIR